MLYVYSEYLFIKFVLFRFAGTHKIVISSSALQWEVIKRQHVMHWIYEPGIKKHQNPIKTHKKVTYTWSRKQHKNIIKTIWK